MPDVYCLALTDLHGDILGYNQKVTAKTTAMHDQIMILKD